MVSVERLREVAQRQLLAHNFVVPKNALKCDPFSVAFLLKNLHLHNRKNPHLRATLCVLNRLHAEAPFVPENTVSGGLGMSYGYYE